MKIRNGFVSNSSTTSFIVALNDSVPCPHCGRIDTDIINIIANTDDYSGDTEILWTDPTQFLIDLKESRASEQEELASYKDQQDDDKAGYKNQYFVKDLRQWRSDSIKYVTKMISSTEQAHAEGKTVVSFDVSTHNRTFIDIIDSQIESGTLTLIERIGD